MNATLRKTALVATALLIGGSAAAVFAEGYEGYGPGMMGYGAGQGPGMMYGQGYGPGRGYGPGGGYGPGMMGGYGPGAMGGYGPGMMGGYGPGAGFLGSLDLTDAQREKIQSIQEENLQKNWAVMGQMRAEMFKLRGLYNSDKLDANALAEQQKKVDELRRQMFKSRIEAQNQLESVLTPEQRKQFRKHRPWFQDNG